MSKVLILKVGYNEILEPSPGHTDYVDYGVSLGDVLRCTVLLHAFKDDDVTWVTAREAFPLLTGNPYVRRLLPYDFTVCMQLQRELFDVVINLEKVPGICALTDSINAWKKLGFRLNPVTGEAEAYEGAQEAIALSREPSEKRRGPNPLSELLFRLIGKRWSGEDYILGYRPKTDVRFDVGLNHHVGEKWPVKAWAHEHWERLAALLTRQGLTVDWQRGLNSLEAYMEWVHSCRAMVTCDSLGAHLALAMHKPVVILFGPTFAEEVYVGESCRKVFPDNPPDCVPCMRPSCDQPTRCIDAIEPERVADEIVEVLGVSRQAATALA